MATTLTGKILAELSWNQIKTGELSSPTDQAKLSSSTSLTAGTDENQIDVLFHDERVVSAATPSDDLDIYGVLVNEFGSTINLAEVVAILIVNLSETTLDKLLVGGAGAGNNAWGAPFNGSQTEKVTVGPSGVMLLSNPIDGLAVTGGSQDVLRIGYSGASGSITYDIVLLGRSA
jgi:hypothetical protein